MRRLLRRHPLIFFFTLAYGLSWGSYFLLSGPGLFPFGPLVAALVVAFATGGTDGLKAMLCRCVRWRVKLRWYLAAILIPLALAVTATFVHVLLGAPAPDAAQIGPWYNLFLLFPAAMVDAPLLEEPAWRGFALPQFPAHRTRLTNTLVLGLLVAGWHLPIALAEPALAAPYLLAAVASAVIINWIYYNARESALLAIVFHSTQNAVGGFYLFRMFEEPYVTRLWWLLAGVYWLAALLLLSTRLRNIFIRNPA